MNSKIILWIVVIGVLGFGVYMMKKDTAPREDAVAGQEETVLKDDEASSGKKMAFSAFMQQDSGAYKCTVKQYLENAESQGTVYLNAGNVRGDFATMVAGKEIKTSFLIKEGYQYVWTSPLASGFKMKVPAPGADRGEYAGMSGSYSWNAEQIGDYDCVDWAADTATFALPSGMMFAEIAQPAPQLE